MIKFALAEIIARKGLNVRTLSRATLIPQTTLHNIHRNKTKNISLTDIELLCSVLKVQPGDLFNLRIDKSTGERSRKRFSGRRAEDRIKRELADFLDDPYWLSKLKEAISDVDQGDDISRTSADFLIGLMTSKMWIPDERVYTLHIKPLLDCHRS